MQTCYATEVAEKGWVHQMEHAGFKAQLMKARRLEDIGRPHGLPTGSAIPVFPIAALPGSPEAWSRDAGTYVCPVDTGWGLWFDWTMNEHLNTAILPSVKGMNPVTGRKLEGFSLEQFADKCPKHDKPFAHARLCQECGYEWPPQSYVCHPNILWWDGFRQPDGKVRQFFFTDEDARDIASLVIGKENTVPAFGFAFYKPKNPRTPPKAPSRDRSYLLSLDADAGPALEAMSFASSGGSLNTVDTLLGEMSVDSSDGSVEVEETTSGGITSDGAKIMSNAASGLSGSSGVSGSSGEIGPTGKKSAAKRLSARVMSMAARERDPVDKLKKSKSVSVGAGAEIAQELNTDSLGLDGWQEEPSAIIRLYFCFEQQFREIVGRGGVVDLQGNSDGYLEGLPTG